MKPCANVYMRFERFGSVWEFSALVDLGSMKPWYGMKYDVCKHKHKENLGMFGIVLERFEALGKCLNAFRAF